MLRITFDSVQIQAGVSFNIMAHPERELPQLESHWIPAVRRFLGTIDAHFHLQGISLPTPNRAGDTNLIDFVLASSLRPAAVRRFNYCRLYLGVTWLSELCTVDGTFIRLKALCGDSTALEFLPRPNGVFQLCPDSTSWRVFRRTLRSLHDSKGRLYRPLGSWTSGIKHGYWPYMQAHGCIIHSDDSGAHTMFRPIASLLDSDTPVYERVDDSVPNLDTFQCMRPVEVHRYEERLIPLDTLTNPGQDMSLDDIPSIPRTFAAVLEELHNTTSIPGHGGRNSSGRGNSRGTHQSY